jgi:hypothetical protein
VSGRDHAIHERGCELVTLASRHLPLEVEVTGDADAWPLIGASLVSRMTGTLRAILILHADGREADAGTLLRTLYEHVVHLAWMGADPSAERIQEWRKDDLESRLKADADIGERGEEVLTGGERSALEQQIARLHGNGLAPLTNLAIAADKHWEGTLPGLGAHVELKSLRGFYALVYRGNSSFSHPTFLGLNLVVDDVSTTRRRVRLENRYEGGGPYGMATLVFAFGLYVAASTLGWPKADEINAILTDTRARRRRA